ncbi:MAG: hypothetical protein R3F33_05510 [Planctomycetota bacterium]
MAILTERNQLLPGASLILDQAEDLPGLPSDPSDGLAHWCARQREWVEGWRALARALQPNELPAGVRFAGWPVIGAFVRARIGR